MTLARLVAAICFTLVAIHIAASTLTAGQGADDFNMVTAFESDEPWIASQVFHNLEEKRIDPELNFTYGYVYQTAGYFIGSVLQKNGFPNNHRSITILMRLVSLLASLLMFFAMFALTRKAGVSPALSWVTASLIFLLPDVTYWSQLVHPDTTQLLFMTLALWNLIPPCTCTNAFLGSVFAGMAFGTKYGGIFILPFTVLPYLLQTKSWPLDNATFVKKFLKWGFFSAALFFAVFILSNPTVPFHPRTFWVWLKFHWGYVNDAEADPSHPWDWIPIWKSEFGIAWMLWLLVGYIFLAFDFIGKMKQKEWRRRVKEKNHAAFLNVGAYFLSSVLYVVFLLKTREFRYGFHLLPVALLLAAYGWHRFLARENQIRSAPFTILIFALLLIPVALRAQQRISPLAKKYDSPIVREGRDLARRYSDRNRLLVDYYVYVPPSLHVMKRVQGVSIADIPNFRPDVVVLSKQMTGRWIWPEDGSRFADKKWAVNKNCFEVCKRSVDFVTTVASDESQWKPVFEGETLAIFEKRKRN